MQKASSRLTLAQAQRTTPYWLINSCRLCPSREQLTFYAELSSDKWRRSWESFDLSLYSFDSIISIISEMICHRCRTLTPRYSNLVFTSACCDKVNSESFIEEKISLGSELWNLECPVRSNPKEDDLSTNLHHIIQNSASGHPKKNAQ